MECSTQEHEELETKLTECLDSRNCKQQSFTAQELAPLTRARSGLATTELVALLPASPAESPRKYSKNEHDEQHLCWARTGTSR
jgi:hypothetical protein